jgi:hypothetical protein
MTATDTHKQLYQAVTDSGLTQKEWYRTIYLFSDHWKELRALALNTHGKICHACRATSRLDVHHLRYRNIFDVQVSDLQILCRSCHDKEHAVTPKRSKPKTRTLSQEEKKLAKTARRRERKAIRKKEAAALLEKKAAIKRAKWRKDVASGITKTLAPSQKAHAKYSAQLHAALPILLKEIADTKNKIKQKPSQCLCARLDSIQKRVLRVESLLHRIR